MNAQRYGGSVSGIGDVNGDGVDDFMASAIEPFIVALSDGDFQDEADIDRNGLVNFSDITPFGFHAIYCATQQPVA